MLEVDNADREHALRRERRKRLSNSLVSIQTQHCTATGLELVQRHHHRNHHSSNS